MRNRVFLGQFLIRLGRFVQSLALMIMRSNDLIEFSRHSYNKPGGVNTANKQSWVDSGLQVHEEALLEKIPLQKGRVLILGAGTGREAISFAKKGFLVTALDFIPALVEKAVANAARHGLEIRGIVQEISELEVPAREYDIIWLSSAMYSSVPEKNRRVQMLKKISHGLSPGGYFACQFHTGKNGFFTPKVELFRRLFALATLGNIKYEKGDLLWQNLEFIHTFSKEEDLRLEFQEGGFKVVSMFFSQELSKGGAVLKSSLNNYRQNI